MLKNKIHYVMKMDKGLKEVYDGIKKIITITEKIEGHTKDIAEIKGYLNDMSHTLAKVEEDVKWQTRLIKWLFGVVGFLAGLILTLL